jgi:hypothetical protein
MEKELKNLILELELQTLKYLRTSITCRSVRITHRN